MTLPATDTFTGSNGTQLSTYSASWTTVKADFDIQSNQLAPDVAATEGGAGWNADTFNNDQYAQATLVASPSADIGVAVRVNVATPNDDYYGFYADVTNAFLFKVINGTWTQIGTNITRPANGSVLRLEAQGTTLTCYDDGASVRAATDSALTSGAAGVAGFGDDASTLLDTWEGGNLALAIYFVAGTAKATTGAPGRTGDGDMTATLPAGWSAGDLALIVLYNDQGSGSIASGWTQVTGSPWGSATPKLHAWYRFLVGGDSGPTITISGSAALAAHCANVVIYRNVNTATPVEVVGTASAGTGTPMTAGAITTGSNNSRVLGLCGRGDNESASTQTFGGSSTGVTEQLDGGTSEGNDAQVSLYDKLYPTSGTSSGNGSAATSATDPWVSVLLALKLATAGVNLTLDAAVVSASGPALDVQPGAISKTLSVAALAASGPAFDVQPGAVSKALAVALLAASGPALDVQPGAFSLLLDAALLLAGGQSFTVSAGGSVNITLAAALLAASGSVLDVQPGAVSKVMAVASLLSSGPVLDVQPGAVSKALAAALLSASGSTLDVQPGAFSLLLDAAAIIASGQAFDVQPGARTISLFVAALASQGQIITIQAGAVSITLDAASLISSGQNLSVLFGTVISLLAATLAVQGQTLTVIPGAVTKVLSAGNLIASGQPLVVPTSPITPAGDSNGRDYRPYATRELWPFTNRRREEELVLAAAHVPS